MTETIITFKEIAKEILHQLGGNRFVAMTGARNFVALESGGIQFDLSATTTMQFGGKKINRVIIILDPSDTYTILCFHIHKEKGNFINKFVDSRSDVYGDNIQDVFYSMTGLMTRFNQH